MLRPTVQRYRRETSAVSLAETWPACSDDERMCAAAVRIEVARERLGDGHGRRRVGQIGDDRRRRTRRRAGQAGEVPGTS